MNEDIINRLLPFIHDEMRMPAGMIKDVIEEIERLREHNEYLKANVEMLLAEAKAMRGD